MPNLDIKDAGAVTRAMKTDTDGTSVYWPVTKMAFGLEGTGYTLVSATNPLPTVADVSGSVAIEAGEEHIGQVGGHTLPVQPAITVDSVNNYAVGEVVGGVITLTNAVRVPLGSGVLQSLVINDASNQKPVLDLIFFKNTPADTYSDNTTFPTGALDNALRLGMVQVAASNWVSLGSGAIATLTNVGLGVHSTQGKNLYMVMVTRSIIDFVNATDLNMELIFLGD